jgi:hypothetical protein
MIDVVASIAESVLVAAIRSGAVTNPIPGRVLRPVLVATMDYGIAEPAKVQTDLVNRNMSGLCALRPEIMR